MKHRRLASGLHSFTPSPTRCGTLEGASRAAPPGGALSEGIWARRLWMARNAASSTTERRSRRLVMREGSAASTVSRTL